METYDKTPFYSSLSHEIATKLDWDGYDISQTFLCALTNANMHELKVKLEVVINEHFETY